MVVSKHRFALAASLALSLVGFACISKSHPATISGDTDSGSSIPGPGGGGGGSSGTPGVDGSTAGACNNVSLTTFAAVTQLEAAEAAPVPIGGTILDGTYVLTKDTIYTGPGGATGSTGMTQTEVQVFSGTTIAIATQPPAPNPAEALSGTFSVPTGTDEAGAPTTGTTMTFVFSCPANAAAVTRSYSVVNNTILEFLSAGEVLTFTAQ